MVEYLFRDFMPVGTIDLAAGVAVIIVLLGIIYKYIQWKKVSPPLLFKDIRSKLGWGELASTFLKELINRVILQRDLIVDSKPRWFAHISMFWGFVGLVATTSLVYLVNPLGEHLPITHPVRILGNIAGIIMLIGVTIAMARFLAISKFRKEQTVGGVWFLVLLFITTVSGFTTQYYGIIVFDSTINSLANLMDLSYAIHLVSLGLLLITAPYSGFMHAITTPSLRYYDRLNQSLITKIHTIDYKEKVITEEAEKFFLTTIDAQKNTATET